VTAKPTGAADATRPRRERLRSQAYREIREHALAQLAEGGVEGISLNAIGKAMGMSGPALYRYFASRDELLAALVVDSYETLADAMAATVELSRRKHPAARFTALATAFRAWSLANPHRYRLLFSHPAGSGALDPETIALASDRTMRLLLDALAHLDPQPADLNVSTRLQRQLNEWDARLRGQHSYPAEVLARGVLAWSRLHGVVSLEIGGVYAQVGINSADIYGLEVEQLIS
jgi:AcrR family transcriptional regulator